MTDPSLLATHPYHIVVDGSDYHFTAEPDSHVLHLLRRHTRMLAAKQGCDVGECGTCTVLSLSQTVENQRCARAVPACQLTTAPLLDQHLVTYDGLGTEPKRWLEAILNEEFATPCGYCRPGLVMRLASILMRVTNENTDILTEQHMTAELVSHLCRCSGYGAWQRVVNRIRAKVAQRDLPPGDWFPDAWWPAEAPSRWSDKGTYAWDGDAHWVADTICLHDLHQGEDHIYGWTALIAAWNDWVPGPLQTTASLPTLWQHPVLGQAMRVSGLACGIAPHPGLPPWQWRFPKLDRPIAFAWERAYFANHLADDLVLALRTRRKGARLTEVSLAIGGFGLPATGLPTIVAPLEATHLNRERRETVIQALATHIQRRHADFFSGNRRGVLRFAMHRLFDQIDDSSTPWPSL